MYSDLQIVYFSRKNEKVSHFFWRKDKIESFCSSSKNSSSNNGFDDDLWNTSSNPSSKNDFDFEKPAPKPYASTITEYVFRKKFKPENFPSSRQKNDIKKMHFKEKIQFLENQPARVVKQSGQPTQLPPKWTCRRNSRMQRPSPATCTSAATRWM